MTLIHEEERVLEAAGPVRRRGRRVLAGVVTLAVVLTLGWWWARSLVPDTYSVMDLGYADFGGGPGAADHAGHGQAAAAAADPTARTVSVADLTGPRDRTPDVRVRLDARHERFTLASAQQVGGYTLNGDSPGPLILAHQGDLVEVTLVNLSVTGGVALHWHGVDVPNAEDGVAGVTQDAVPVGGRHVYRFVAAHAGTYWYHSHQVSHEQVRLGLFGPLLVMPGTPTADAPQEVLALAHTYSGSRTINGRIGVTQVAVAPGRTARVRVINTDGGPLRTWVTGADFAVVAIDGHDLHGPTPVHREALVVPAGGRADLAVTMPSGGTAVRVELGGGSTYVVLGTGLAPGSTRSPRTTVDLLHYGTPAPLGFDPTHPDRSFAFSIGRRPGFLDGRPGLWWSINGHVFPDVPMFVVAEGDVVRMRIENSSGQAHPMHLHGHHAVVLSRDGSAATGSPWWVDSLEVADGESYEIAFVADNPGIWMDHCHDLLHAAEGLVAHLAYAGVTEPYRIGGDAANAPD